MSGKLPRLTAAEAIKALEKIGFYLARASGGHRIYKNSEGKRVTFDGYSVRSQAYEKLRLYDSMRRSAWRKM